MTDAAALQYVSDQFMQNLAVSICTDRKLPLRSRQINLIRRAPLARSVLKKFNHVQCFHRAGVVKIPFSKPVARAPYFEMAAQGCGHMPAVSDCRLSPSPRADRQRISADHPPVPEIHSVATERYLMFGDETALPHVPQLSVHVDRVKALAQGVVLNNVYTTMQAFMGGTLVNYFNRFARQWQTYVEADGNERTMGDNIGRFYVPTANGGRVPLSAITTVKQINGPEYLMHFNEYGAAQISVSGKPGYSSGQVMAALEDVFDKTMPSGMGYDYKDMSFQEKHASKGTSSLMTYAFSLTFAFLILAAQYERWTLPFSVLLGTPIALLGAYLVLWSRSLENDVYAKIGVVMIIGLAVKNAILIVEYAKMNFDAGTPLVEASLGAARLRLCPILMIAFAFILGCISLWTASDSGAQARRILGTVCIGGMLMASLIEILIIPVLFVSVERISHHFKKRSLGNEAQSAPTPEAAGGAE